MKLNNYKNLTQAIQGFQKKGFSRSFGFENGNLKCYQTGKIYQTNDIEIVEFHRFKNDSRHPFESVIFAIACKDGEKGYTSSSERNLANFRILEFMDKVKIQLRNHIAKPQQYRAQY